MNILRAIMGMLNNKPYYEVAHFSIIFLLIGFGFFFGVFYVQSEAYFGLPQRRKACHKYGRHISYRALPDQRYLLAHLYRQAKEDGNDTLMALCTKKETDMISGKFYYKQYRKLRFRDPKRAKSSLYEAAHKNYRRCRKQYIRIAERDRNYEHLTEFYYAEAHNGDGISAWKLHCLFEENHAAPHNAVPRDYPHESALFLFIAAEQGVKKAAKKYADFLSKRSTHSNQLFFAVQFADVPADDFENRTKFAMYAAAYGSETHMLRAAQLLITDDSPIKNPPLAFLFMRAAANRGNRLAISNLGMMHSDGIGTEKNEQEAFRCFEKAADLGYGRACANAAQHCHNTKKDYYAAAKWLRRGIELGDPDCMYNYASFYITNGYANTPKDSQLKNALIRTAAEFGQEAAQRECFSAYHERFYKTCFEELDVGMIIRLKGKEYSIESFVKDAMPYTCPEIPSLRQVPSVRLQMQSCDTGDDVTMHIPNTASLPRVYRIL